MDAQNSENYKSPRIRSKIQPLVFTHNRPSSDEEESPVETANKILRMSREEQTRLEKVNQSTLESANEIIQENREKKHFCTECDVTFGTYGEMYFHWLCKHRMGKDRIDLFREYPSYDPPEEIEVDEFIKKVGTREVQLDMMPKTTIEPCYSVSDASEEDFRRVFDSSSDSDIEPEPVNTKDKEEPMSIVTSPGSRRMSTEPNEDRIVHMIDSDEASNHDPAHQEHVSADKDLSEGSHHKE